MIGTDIVANERIKMLYAKKKNKFIEKILTKQEQIDFSALPSHAKITFLAGRWSAKEAYAKATGKGINAKLSFRDIQISNDKFGKPYFVNDSSAQLSIAHEKDYTISMVIIWKDHHEG